MDMLTNKYNINCIREFCYRGCNKISKQEQLLSLGKI